MKKNNKKEIKVVTNDNSDLDISEVYDNISNFKPINKKKCNKKIVIPKSKKNKK